MPAETLKWALAGFANGTVWLIFAAFVVAMGYEQTRLGRRIALFLVRHLGGRTLGLGYAIALRRSRAGAVHSVEHRAQRGDDLSDHPQHPRAVRIAPGDSPRRIGAYLMWVAFATTCVTSSMFVTALAPNLLALEMVKAATGIEITWTEWLVGFLPVGAAARSSCCRTSSTRSIRRRSATSVEVPQWAALGAGSHGPHVGARDDHGVAGRSAP